MATITKTSVLPSLFIFAVVQLVSANSEVKMMNLTYPCCDQRSVGFDHHCDNVLISNDSPFAFYKKQGTKQGCIAPCREIEDGRVVLQQCVDLQVSTVCRSGFDKVHERRTSFRSIPCSGSGLAPGSVVLLLLLLVFTLDLWTL